MLLHMHSHYLANSTYNGPPSAPRTKEEKKNMETKSSSPKGESQFLQQMVETRASPASSSSSTTAAASATSPPPSLSSSPSHDFTFTISLYPSPPKGQNKSVAKPRTSGKAIDLAPADDIFFHGHLLPLRLLTRPPFSPRRSAENLVISVDSNSANVAEQSKENPSNELTKKACDAKERIKASKSFSSLIMGLAKWRREAEKEEEDEEDIDRDKDKDKKKDAKKKKFDMKRMLKKYTSLVDALFPSRGMAKERRDIRQRPYSFSGVSNNWSRGGGGRGGGGGGGRDDDCRRRGKKRWGQLSAPASMRTSPSNSGLLVPPPNLGSSDESTMEELQNAIQAAISHCKNSMNTKEETCKV